MTKRSDSSNPANLAATAILDIQHEEIQRIAAMLLQSHEASLPFLREAHVHLVETLCSVYSVNEWQPASITLRRGQGSCSQRIAVLEAIARAAGIPTRVHAFGVKGSFWYPRFRVTRLFVPKCILLLWPQFLVGEQWADFDELHAAADQMAARAAGGFTNTGESLFEAVANTPIDFLGKTCGLACAGPEHDLSRFLVTNFGLFDTRDEAFDRLGSFQHTLRGRAFELVFGGCKSRNAN